MLGAPDADREPADPGERRPGQSPLAADRAPPAGYDVAVIGGGLAGCYCASALAAEGYRVALLEKADRLGGRVAEMGCKAADACVDCGVCLSAGLWDRTATAPGLDLFLGTRLVDCRGRDGDFSLTVRRGDVSKIISTRQLIAATGHSLAGLAEGTHVELGGAELPSRRPAVASAARGATSRAAAGGLAPGCSRPDGGTSQDARRLGPVISGADIERLMLDRKEELFAEAPGRVAFIQCYGSRDETQKAGYCSRVCCSYATRSARLIRALHPGTEVDMFFMDLQKVGRGCSEAELAEAGISVLRARPEKITVSGGAATVQFEADGIRRREYGLVVLSCGIAPGDDVDRLAELLGLGFDADGFLAEAGPGEKTGVFVAGSAGGPKRIAEARADALSVAARVSASLSATRSASRSGGSR